MGNKLHFSYSFVANVGVNLFFNVFNLEKYLLLQMLFYMNNDC